MVETILLIYGVSLIANVRYPGCDELIHIPEIHCIGSGYSIGYILYLLGISILILNGLQMSIYPRVKGTDIYRSKI